MAKFGCSCCAAVVCDKPDAWWREDESVAPSRFYQSGGLFRSDNRNISDIVDLFYFDQGLVNNTEPRDLARGPDAADTVTDTISSSASIAIGSSVLVDIETPTDHDWYRVTLTAGTTYVFHTTSVTGTNPDPYITLRNASGAQIAVNDDGGDGTNSLISFTATTTGTYFLDAGTYSGQGQSSSGTYHLSLTAIPAAAGDIVGATAATAGALNVGGSASGNIDIVGDRDWYAVTLTAGTTYLFRTGSTTALAAPVNGAPSPGSVDTLLTLRDGSGASLSSSDDAGQHGYSAIRFTATTTGTYYLDVGAYSGQGANGASTGGFILTAFTTPALTVFTNDQISNQLTNGYWGGSSHRFNVTAGGTITYNLGAISAAAMTLAREAFNLWSDATGITFSEVTSGGEITFIDTDEGAYASAVYQGGITTSATINVAADWNGGNFALNSYSFQTFIHEIGHVLGLGHGGNYNGNASYAVDALYANDAWVTTIMSYFDPRENSYFGDQGFTRQFSLSPMVADIIATTALYGTATTTRMGNTTYGFNNNSGRAIYDATANPVISYTIVDHGGTDTLDYSGFAQNQRINLNAETFSDVGGRVGNVSIARGTVIENVIGGSGNDTIIGNAGVNLFDLSRGGIDTVDGGLGSDAFLFGATLTSADRVIGGGGGFDEVGISGNYTGANALVLGANTLSDIDMLSAMPGGSYSITLNDAQTAAGTQFIVFGGNLGVGENFTVDASLETNATIVTYGGLGTDTIVGGAMGDGFYFGNGKYGASDSVTGGGGANDELALAGNYTITVTSREDVEILTLLPGRAETPFTYNITVADSFVPVGQSRTIWGARMLTSMTVDGSAESNGNLTFFGGTVSDILIGGSGNDTISGGGGGDTLRGGAGNDTFRYADISDSNGTTNATRDHILDFTSGDRITLSRIDAITGGSDDAFAFIGNSAFTNTAGQLRSSDNGDGTHTVEGDVNGDGVADFAILVTAATPLGSGDFIL
jgi:serralysin